MRGLNAADPLSDDEAAALFAPFAHVPRLVLAVSGGPDSTALMGLFAAWRKNQLQNHAGPAALVATVDHGLRPEAAAEAAGVVAAAGALGFEAVVLHWSGVKPETGLQEAARDARYELLDQLCRQHGAAGVMLAHTLDDQAETVLMRLARGTGLRGLAGMQASSGPQDARRFRPFLSVPKARLVATCAARGWPVVHDPSNDSDRFLRPRLRRLLPLLAAEGLDAERLALLARRAARAERTLDALTDTVLADAPVRAVRVTALCAYGPDILIRVLERVIRNAAPAGARGPRLEKIEALAGRLETAIAAGLPLHATLGGAKLTLDGEYLRVSPAPRRRAR